MKEEDGLGPGDPKAGVGRRWEDTDGGTEREFPRA